MLLVWTTAYARCSAELHGWAEGAAACCQHDQPADQHTPLDGHTNCGLCKMLVTGGMQAGAFVLFLCMLLFAVVLPAALNLLGFLRQLLASRLFVPRWRLLPSQHRKPRLAEFLASTACPVRGPAGQMMA